MNLIGVAGQAGSGKSTVASILEKEFGFSVVSLADPMKRACAEWFNWDAETLWGPSEKRNEPHTRLGGLTARKALQLLGTEYGRTCYENVWVDIAIRMASAVLQTGAGYTPHRGMVARFDNRPIPGVVIPDCRYQNEVAAIRKAGGKVWRIERSVGDSDAAWRQHASEKEIDSLDVNWILNNCGTIDELKAMIEIAMRDSHPYVGPV